MECAGRCRDCKSRRSGGTCGDISADFPSLSAFGRNAMTLSDQRNPTVESKMGCSWVFDPGLNPGSNGVGEKGLGGQARNSKMCS